MLIKNHTADIVRVADGAHDEVAVVFFGRGFNFDRAEVEKCRNEAVNVDGHILNFVKWQIGNFAVENLFLLDINDTLVRHIPNIQMKFGPLNEKRNPEKKQPERIEKQKIRRSVTGKRNERQNLRQENFDQQKNGAGQNCHDQE